MTTTVKLQETLRAVFYTPFYLALELGAYERHGIEIEFGRPEVPSDAARTLFNGQADVSWGGPMRMMQYMDSHGVGSIVGFAEAVTRDPFYLLGTDPNPQFVFADLEGKALCPVSEVPTPWICLKDDLGRASVDVASMALIEGRTMAENADALRTREVDVIQVFEPFVEALVDEGAGHIWYAASTRGPTSYTTLYTSREYAEAQPEVLGAMAKAVQDALVWLHGHTGLAVAEQIACYFPELDVARLAGAVERYQAFNVWGRDPVLPLEGFVRLKSALIADGFITSDIPFESCVDNRFALAAADRTRS